MEISTDTVIGSHHIYKETCTAVAISYHRGDAKCEKEEAGFAWFVCIIGEETGFTH